MKLANQVLCVFMLSVSTLICAETPDRVLLAKAYPLEALRENILQREEWRPFPTCDDPAGFDEIPAEVRRLHIAEAEKLLNADWHILPATNFLQYARDGNRSNYEQISFERRRQLANLVLGEVFERQGRFIDQIANGVWAICEESFWGVPAHNYGRGLPDVADPIIDLFAAETASLLALTYYLLAPQLDAVSPQITKRMILETDRRILTPYFEREFGWMGFEWRRRTGYERPVNNWNPWINSNVILCALIMEPDAERRLQILHKCMDSVDTFVEGYPADGGCDEGPSYWGRAGASLFDCLERLHNASNGKIDVYSSPLIKNIGAFIYKAYISNPWVINFSDASAQMRIEAPLVYRYGKAVGDQTMTAFAAFAAQQQKLGVQPLVSQFGGLHRTLPALFCMKELLSAPAAEPLLRDVWLPDIQVMAARSFAGSTRGYYIAAKGGHNDESHNHNDVGNFIVYADGQPLLIDAGAQTYTAATFSNRRYELWNNQSAYHNLPTINGATQKEGHTYQAKNVRHAASKSKAVLSLDIAATYPEEAQVASWLRNITLNRGRNVVIKETYRLSKAVTPVKLHFLTPTAPSVESAGQINLHSADNSSRHRLSYDASRFIPLIETVEINDSRMSGNWGSQIYQITLTGKMTELEGKIRIVIKEVK